MKFKKLLSAVAATAIAASAFAGMAVTASAAISITAINTISESTVFTFNDEDTADGAVAGGAYIELKNKLYYYVGGTAKGYTITETMPNGVSAYTKAYKGAHGDKGNAAFVFKA